MMGLLLHFILKARTAKGFSMFKVLPFLAFLAMIFVWANAQAQSQNTTVSVEKEIKISAAIEKEKGHGTHYAVEIEYENIKTGKKYATAYEVEVEILTPYREDHYTLPRFKIHFTPYKRQIFGNGIPSAELKNALVIGKTEIKRDGELFNISVFGIGAEFSREYELGLSGLRLILEMGLHTLGYRHFQRGDSISAFTGFELIGAYPGAEVEYDLNKTYTLAFSAENESKVSAARFQKPIVENAFSSQISIKTKFDSGLFKNLDSIWYKNKNVSNSTGTFSSEKAHEFGMTWFIKKEQHIEPRELCTLTVEEKAAGWKCLQP